MKTREKSYDRICKHCKNGCEDEEHFVMLCPLYDDLRTDLFKHVLEKYPFLKEYDPFKQYIWLMASADPVIIILVAEFVYKCFEKRSLPGVD